MEQEVQDPPASGKQKIKKDYGKLRERQLEVSLSDNFREKHGQIRDDNPPGYTGRTYTELAKVKMPLILDQIQDEHGVPRKSWTVEEILRAMQPSIIALSGQYSRKRAAFQADEAESLGREAVLTTLWTDLGLAWFAGYCYEKIEAAIRRGAKTSGTIKASERRREYRDKVRSTDDPLGEGDGTIAETIRDSTPIVRRERCGDYYKDKKKVPKGTTGAVFVHTCKNGNLPSGEVCDRCNGSGRIIVYEDRRVRTPGDIAAERIRVKEFKKVFGELTNGLTSIQLDILMLKEGLDEEGAGRKRDATEVASIMKERDRVTQKRELEEQKIALQAQIAVETNQITKNGLEKQLEITLGILSRPIIGMCSKNRVSQVLEAVYRKLQDKQSKSKGLTEAIDRILDLDEVGDY